MDNTKMTTEQEVWFVYGYMYSQAEKLKKDGLFEDLSIKELIMLLLNKNI